LSQEERYGQRDLSYSAWHRVRSIARYVGFEAAQGLKMIDQDVTLYLELDGLCRSPLALIETAQDVGQENKPASATARLASLCGLPAFAVLYKPAQCPNPADPREFDIEAFRVRRIWPSPEHEWRTLTPEQWAKGLMQIRRWSAARIDVAANDAEWEKPPHQGTLFQGLEA
jgi:hypothetical protein